MRKLLFATLAVLAIGSFALAPAFAAGGATGKNIGASSAKAAGGASAEAPGQNKETSA